MPRSFTFLTRHLPGLRWLALALGLASAMAWGQGPISLNADAEIEIAARGQLYVAQEEAPPPTAAQLPAWLAKQKQVERVSLFGGAYWFYATVHNDTPQTRWVVDPTGTLIERIEVRVYTPGLPVQSFVTGYNTNGSYMLHYGGNIELPAGAQAQLLLHIQSRYFARYPSVLSDHHVLEFIIVLTLVNIFFVHYRIGKYRESKL